MPRPMTDPTLYNRFQANKEYNVAKPWSDDLRSEIAKDRDRIVQLTEAVERRRQRIVSRQR